MAVRIDAVSAVRPPGLSDDSRSLAAWSAEACMERGSGNGEATVPLLVYAGVYRDGNVVEPAQAPYAQRHLAEKRRMAGTAFSFDVDHLMPGIEIADGMIRSQRLERAMVVAVDSGVIFTEPKDCRVHPAAGALLLSPSDNGEGFSAFRTDVFPEHRELHQGRLVWIEPGNGTPPHHEMIVAQSPGYLSACVKAARDAVEAFVDDVDLVLDDDTLIVPSQTPIGFPEALRDVLGLSERTVVDAADALGAAHTAGPLLALDKAMQDGRFARAKRVLFVTVTPGIVVSIALYDR